MAGMVRFEDGVEGAAQQAIEQRRAVTINLMDETAIRVVVEGGNCDQQVFMTAFWGHDVSPSQEYVNTMVLARKINVEEEFAYVPRDASRLFSLVGEVSLNIGQPFVFDGVQAGYSSLRLAMRDESELAVNNIRYMIEPNRSIDPTNPTSFLGTVSMLALHLPPKNKRGPAEVSRLTLGRVRRDLHDEVAEISGLPDSKICGTSNVRLHFAKTSSPVADTELNHRISQLWQAAEEHNTSTSTIS